MKLDKAIEIKQKYQYILHDASLPELIQADNLSIEALKLIHRYRADQDDDRFFKLPGETLPDSHQLSQDQIKKLRESPIGQK